MASEDEHSSPLVKGDPQYDHCLCLLELAREANEPRALTGTGGVAMRLVAHSLATLQQLAEAEADGRGEFRTAIAGLGGQAVLHRTLWRERVAQCWFPNDPALGLMDDALSGLLDLLRTVEGAVFGEVGEAKPADRSLFK